MVSAARAWLAARLAVASARAPSAIREIMGVLLLKTTSAAGRCVSMSGRIEARAHDPVKNSRAEGSQRVDAVEKVGDERAGPRPGGFGRSFRYPLLEGMA